MGLDQSVTIKQTSKNEEKELFYWRKHPNLQGWMENLWRDKTGNQTDDFNLVHLDLNLSDIENLEEAILSNSLPETSGFFFGTSTPDRKEEDLEFIKLAKEELSKGNEIYYSSWW